MELFKRIFYLVYAIIYVITIVIFIIKSVTKNNKYNKTLAFLETVKQYMELAEQQAGWSGEQKKMYVLAMLTPNMEKLGITGEQAEKIIENYILFSKQINYLNSKEQNNE